MVNPENNSFDIKIHPNTRNIAGMLRYRLLALGIKQPDFKDLLGYGFGFRELHWNFQFGKFIACQNEYRSIIQMDRIKI